MIKITLNTIDKLEEWGISGNACYIVPRNVPIELNPAAQEAKKQQEKIDELEKKIAKGKKHRNQNGGGDEKRRKTDSSTTSAAGTVDNANGKGAGGDKDCHLRKRSDTILTRYNIV